MCWKKKRKFIFSLTQNTLTLSKTFYFVRFSWAEILILNYSELIFFRLCLFIQQLQSCNYLSTDISKASFLMEYDPTFFCTNISGFLQCLRGVNTSYSWACIKILCNHCFLIRRYHHVALLRIRSHDILLFSTQSKSAGNALWGSVSVMTNAVEMRCLSEGTAGTE